jgi:hypothetical protein
VDFFSTVDNWWKDLSSYSVWVAVVHTAMASAVAGLAFYVFRIHGPDNLDVFKMASNVQALQKKYPDTGKSILSSLRGYIFAYSVLTGLLAAALISLLFSNQASIPTAIIYGTLGPFVLRDTARSTLGRTAMTDLTRTVDVIQGSVKNDYKNEIANILKQKEQKSGIEEISSELGVEETFDK